MSDYDLSIHQNPDAQAWARFFLETLKEQNWTIEDIDEDLMIAWFANAMMAMYDHVCIKHQKEKDRIEQECDQLKAAVSVAIDAFQKYEMDVDAYPTTDHVRMMNQLKGALVKHDAEVIEIHFKRLSLEYMKHPSKMFSAFNVAQHIEAQSKYYSNELRQKEQEV